MHITNIGEKIIPSQYLALSFVGTYLFISSFILAIFSCFFCRRIYFYQSLYVFPESSGLYFSSFPRQLYPQKQLHLTCTHVRTKYLQPRPLSSDPYLYIQLPTIVYPMTKHIKLRKYKTDLINLHLLCFYCCLSQWMAPLSITQDKPKSKESNFN